MSLTVDGLESGRARTRIGANWLFSGHDQANRRPLGSLTDTPPLPTVAHRRYAQANLAGGPMRVALSEPEEGTPGFNARTLMPNLRRLVEEIRPSLDREPFSRVAEASLRAVANLDRTRGLAVERDGRDLVLMHGDVELERFPAPANLFQWAGGAERVVRAFARVSPAIADASDAQLTDAFYRGLADALPGLASYRPSTEPTSIVATATDGDVVGDEVSGVGILRVPNVSMVSVRRVEDLLEGWGLLGEGQPQVSGIVLDLTHALGNDAYAAQVLTEAFLRRVPEHIPVVVLTNGATRGGPEIVAQALQANRRAVIHGTTTLGEVLPTAVRPTGEMVVHGGGALTFATGEALAPAGLAIQGRGLTPQVCASPGDRSCAASPSRAIVTGPSFQPFENPDGEAWTASAVALALDPVRYREALGSRP